MSDGAGAYCVFCGSSVAVDVRTGFFGQRAEVECEACETRYNLEVSVREGGDE